MTSDRTIDDYVSDRDSFGKIIADSVHGTINTHPLVQAIIDTPEFQRLRRLTCTGLAHYVFPGAIHKRFEHSIGVSHLAEKLVLELGRRQRCLDITYADVLCVTLAGLLHDVGHGPYSHSWEVLINRISDSKSAPPFRHEDMSVKIIDRILGAEPISRLFDRYGLRKGIDDVFIKELINGWSKLGPFGRGPDKIFLYEIVANKRNNIDVDRWDYLNRDSKCSGVAVDFDHGRLLAQARVVLDEKGIRTIAYRDRTAVWNMFRTRRHLFKTIYQHRVVKIIEGMWLDANEAANLEYKVRSGQTHYKMSQAHENVDAYLKLDESVFGEFRRSDLVAYKQCKEIQKRIDERNLYRVVGKIAVAVDRAARTADGRYLVYQNFLKDPNMSERMLKGVAEKMNESLDAATGDQRITPLDFTTMRIKFDYGGVDPSDHPLASCYFYDKATTSEEVESGIKFHQNQLREAAANHCDWVEDLVVLRRECKHASVLDSPGHRLLSAAKHALNDWWNGELSQFEKANYTLSIPANDDSLHSEHNVSLPADAGYSTAASSPGASPEQNEGEKTMKKAEGTERPDFDRDDLPSLGEL